MSRASLPAFNSLQEELEARARASEAIFLPTRSWMNNEGTKLLCISQHIEKNWYGFCPQIFLYIKDCFGETRETLVWKSAVLVVFANVQIPQKQETLRRKVKHMFIALVRSAKIEQFTQWLHGIIRENGSGILMQMPMIQMVQNWTSQLPRFNLLPTKKSHLLQRLLFPMTAFTLTFRRITCQINTVLTVLRNSILLFIRFYNNHWPD